MKVLLALQKIGTEIYTGEHHARGALAWLAPGDGFGFPVPRNMRDKLIGADRNE